MKTMLPSVLLLLGILVSLSQKSEVFGANDLILQYISKHVHIKYDVVDNLVYSDVEKKKFKAKLTLINTGTTEVTKGNWSIYFCHVRMIEPDTLPNPNGTILGNSGLKVTHINGCLFKLETTDDFKTLGRDQKVEASFESQYWQVAKTDVMPNWYVAAENTRPRVIVNTATETLDFVGPFETINKWKRSTKDQFNPYTPETRFQRIDANKKALSMRIVPSVQEDNLDREGDKVNILTGDWLVHSSTDVAKEAKLLSEKLGLPITNSTPPNRYVSLQLGDVIAANSPGWSKNETYRINIDVQNELITITGNSAAAVFYGVQTLLSLVEESPSIPGGTIIDYPRYPYRGLHFDVGRNFHDSEVVKRVMDAMAMYKMNKFHFHLSDDEGWRLEILGLKELTSIAGQRCHDLDETKCLIPQLGSGPVTGTRGTGFYTIQKYKEILQYANDRYIEVIPEFDMPGHIHSAVKAMEARYKFYMATGDPAAATKYLISDLNDTTRYLSEQLWTDNAMNPCINSTYTFVDHIIKTIVDMHKDVQPLKIFHFGGDEVAKGAWVYSPACKTFFDQNKFNTTKDLKEYFVQKVAEIAAKYSLALAGWEDGLIGERNVPYNRSGIKNSDIYSNPWQNIWEWHKGNRTYLLANAGYKVILSLATHLYFDHPYEPDPEERGFYWATRFTDTRKTFGFIADDIYENIDMTRFGDKQSREEICKQNGSCPALTKRENVVGMQGQLWSETVRTDEQVDSLLFPRLLALAERAWYRAKWENISDSKQREEAIKQDWEQFANVLGQKELARLDKMGIQYHIPIPGAMYGPNGLEAKTAFPGLKLHFSENGGETWSEYQKPTLFSGGSTIHVKTRSADYRRDSRAVRVKVEETSGSTPAAGLTVTWCVILAIVTQIIHT